MFDLLHELKHTVYDWYLFWNLGFLKYKLGIQKTPVCNKYENAEGQVVSA